MAKNLSEIHLSNHHVEYKKVLHLLSSSVGPTGGLKLFQTGQAIVSLTSSSSRIFKGFSTNDPVVKIVLSNSRTLLSNCFDGGLRCAVQMLAILLSADNVSTSKPLQIDIFDFLLEKSMDLLRKSERIHRYAFNFGSTEDLLSLVKSHLSSKTMSSLFSTNSIDHVGRLILQAFISALDTSNLTVDLDNIVIMSHSGRDMLHSFLTPGILIHIPTNYYPDKTILPRNTCGDTVRVILINFPIDTGTWDQAATSAFEIDFNRAVCMKGTISKSEQLILAMQKMNIRCLLSQKVISAESRLLFRRNGIFVIDRIGLRLFKPLCVLSGCVAMSASTSFPGQKHIGHLHNFQLASFFGKEYIHLHSADTRVNTLQLFGLFEEQTEEIVTICTATFSVLRACLKYPVFYSGAGCWNTQLVAELNHLISDNADSFAESLDCSKTDLLLVTAVYKHSLLSMIGRRTQSFAFSDRTFNHLWLSSSTATPAIGQSCACGSIKYTTKNHLKFLALPTCTNFVHVADLNCSARQDLNVFSTTAAECSVKRPKIIDSGHVVENMLHTVIATINMLLNSKRRYVEKS